MKQDNDDILDELPPGDETPDGDSLAIDGLLRELGQGPADPCEVDEQFVQRIVAAIKAGKAVKSGSAVLPAAKSSGGTRAVASVSSASLRMRKSKTASRGKPASVLKWTVGVPIAACLLLAIGLYLFRSAPVDRLASVFEFGGECVLIKDGKETDVAIGSGVFANDVLRIPINGWAVVAYPDGTRVTAQAGSTLTFHAAETEISKKVIVNEGTLVANVTKQTAGQAMVILTPDLESRVLGTKLIVSVTKKSAGPARSRVDVEEGRVRVTQLSDKASVDVSRGQYALVAPGEKFGVRHTKIDLGSSLVGHWRLDEGTGMTLSDASGQGNMGKIYGATWAQGQQGGALNFAGNEYVEMLIGSGLNTGTDFSICGWVKLSALNRNQTIAGCQDASGSGYKLTVSERNQLDFEICNPRNPAAQRGSESGTTLRNGQWYQVASVYSTSENVVRLYVNGELDRTISVSQIPNPPSGFFTVGAESFGYRAYKIQGMIDDVRVYKRALNEAEIRKLASPLLR